MRLFLAIEVPEKIKAKLEKEIQLIKKEYPQFNWVTPENFHITLYFFGERNDLEKIKRRVKDLVWDQFAFHLYSFKLDVFVNNKLVVYLTFNREKKIEALALKIKNNFNNNLVYNQKFIPHLTLARGPRSSKQQYFALKRKLEKTLIDISFPVKKIILYQSILDGRKPIYKKLETFDLVVE